MKTQISFHKDGIITFTPIVDGLAKRNRRKERQGIFLFLLLLILIALEMLKDTRF